MARPKKEIDEQETTDKPAKSASDIIAMISRSMNKTLGEGTAIILKDGEFDNVTDYVKTGVYVIDYLLGKGFPVGKVSEIYGQPSSGKTAIAMHVLKTTVDRGGIAFMIDSEAAFGFDMAKKIGLDVTQIGYTTPNTLEGIWRQIELIIAKVKEVASDRLVTIVVDSIAAASSENEIANDITKAEMGERARINSKGIRKVTVDIKDNNICLLLLNQVRVNIGQMFGDKDAIPGGNAIEFVASIKLRANKSKAIEHPTEKKVPIGQITKLKVTKNKVAPPFREADIELYFDRGVPIYSGLVEFLLSRKVFARKGGSIVFKDIKFKEENIGEFIQEHPYLLDFDNLSTHTTEQEDE